MYRRSVAALALAAVLAGGTALVLPPISADAQAQRQVDQAAFMPSRHIEGRIAYLKAELQITDTQSPLWNKVADTMRDNAKVMDGLAGSRHRDPNAAPPSALERMEMRTKLAGAHAQGAERMLAAFRPLYESMSPDQKKNADEILGRHFHFRHR